MAAKTDTEVVIGGRVITLSGFEVSQAATQWAPPTAYQEGMIGPHWSKGWIIEDCEVYESKCSGISLGKYNRRTTTTNGLRQNTRTELRLNATVSARPRLKAGLRKTSAHTLSAAATFTTVVRPELLDTSAEFSL